MQVANWKEYVDSGVSEGIVAVEDLEGRRVVAVVVQQHRKALAHSDEAVEGNPGVKKVAVDMVVLFTNKPSFYRNLSKLLALLWVRCIVSLRILLWRRSLRWIGSAITLTMPTILVRRLSLGHGCVQ